MCILRVLQPTRGSIYFDGKDISALGREESWRFRRDVQIIFQDPSTSLNPAMTVQHIVADPLTIHGVGKADALRRAEEM